MNKNEANNEILNIIMEYCDKNPDLRFHQALWNLGLHEWLNGNCQNGMKDKGHQDSQVTLRKLRARIGCGKMGNWKL